MKYVSSGKGTVIDVNAQNEVFKRKGISAETPTGTAWARLRGINLTMADAYNAGTIWGVDDPDKIYHN